MGLFRSSSHTKQQAKPTSNEAISSIIAREMRITGEIVFKGKTRIDGVLEGNIKGEYLILSESGKVYGDLTIDTLVCHGLIQGDIEANTVTVHKTATIRGKLASSNLTVEPGASIEGEIHAVTTSQANTAPARKPKQPAPVQKATPAKPATSRDSAN